MSGESDNQTTQQSGPPSWLQGPIQDYLSAAGGVAAQPYEQYQGQRVAGFTPLQEQAFQGIGSTMHGSQGLDNAQGFVSGVLAGNNGAGNPELNNVINRSQRNVIGAYNNATADQTRRFNKPGAWGGASQQIAMRNNEDALTQGLGDVASGINYQDYTGNLNRQLQAAPMALQLAQGQQGLYQGGLQAGNLQQGYGQSLLDSLYGDWQANQNSGRNSLDWYGNALGRVMGGAGQQTTTTQPGTSPWSSALGTAMLGYGLFGGK